MTFNHLVYLASRHLDGFRLFRYLARNHPRILMYHRLVPEGGAYSGTRESDFRRQMEFLAHHFNVVSVEELVQRTREKLPIPENAVALTFDDGYRDFYEIAYPILKELGLPATIYVVTDFIDGKLWLWPDLIRQSLTVARAQGQSEVGFGELTLEIREKGLDYCWNKAADYCLTLEDGRKWELLNELAGDTGLSAESPAPSPYNALDWAQLREIVDSGITVGSHSRSHPILSHVSRYQLKDEIYGSKRKIEEKLEIEVQGFCYPNGRFCDFNENVTKAVIDAGYAYAAAAYPSKSPLSDLNAIKRYAVGDAPGDFEKTVCGLKFFGLNSKAPSEGFGESSSYY